MSEYKNLFIKKIEFNEYGHVASVEFADGASAKEVTEFLSTHGIGHQFARPVIASELEISNAYEVVKSHVAN